MPYTRDSSNFPRRKLDSKIFSAYSNGSQLINASLQKDWNTYTTGMTQKVGKQIGTYFLSNIK